MVFGIQVVIRAIRKVAATQRAVICTIHQPSTYLFEMFDALLLLKKGGQSVFFGATGVNSCNLVAYLEVRRESLIPSSTRFPWAVLSGNNKILLRRKWNDGATLIWTPFALRTIHLFQLSHVFNRCPRLRKSFPRVSFPFDHGSDKQRLRSTNSRFRKKNACHRRPDHQDMVGSGNRGSFAPTKLKEPLMRLCQLCPSLHLQPSTTYTS